MHLDAGAVDRHGFNPDARNLAALQLGKDAVEHACPGPAAHARVDGVPVAQVLGQATPLAAVLDHVEHGVERLQVGQLDVAALHRQAVRDFFVLGLGELHGWIFQSEHAACLVLTSPSEACSPAQSWRACATSARSCSAACTVFFFASAPPVLLPCPWW